MNNEKPLRNIKPITDDKLRNIKFNQITYRNAIGNLLYIAICTRPDILFSEYYSLSEYGKHCIWY